MGRTCTGKCTAIWNWNLYIEFVRSLYGPYRGSYKVLIWSVYNSKYAMVVLTYHNFKSFFKKLVDLLQQGTFCINFINTLVDLFTSEWTFPERNRTLYNPSPSGKLRGKPPWNFRIFSFFYWYPRQGDCEFF